MISKAGFQVIVLAGGQGSRMTELTAGKPKCLLPIANKPMIWYPLNILEESGFSEAIIIVSETVKMDVCAAIEKFNLKIKTDVVGVPDAENIGTADSIRLIHEKIHSDVIFISTDLIAKIDLSKTIELYHKHNASITTLFFQMPELPESFKQPGPKSKQKSERDLVGIEEETGRLVYFASAVDFTKTITNVNKLVKKHTNILMYSKLMDSHIYIMKKWVLDFLVYHRKFSTIKGDLVPYIVKKQLDKPKTLAEDKNASVVKVDVKRDIFSFAKEDIHDNLIRNMSSFNDHDTDLDDSYHGDIIRCYAHIVTDSPGFRANSLQMYSYANAMINNWYKYEESALVETIVSPNAVVKCTQMLNTNIDDNALIKEKTSLKHSNISSDVTVESKTGISKSILMNNVTVKEKCIIENSIICNDCVIEEGTKLVDCVVSANHTIPAGSTHTQEEVGNIDRLMEID